MVAWLPRVSSDLGTLTSGRLESRLKGSNHEETALSAAAA